MTTRADLLAVQWRTTLRFNRWQRTLREEALTAYRQRVALSGQFDQMAYVLLRADLDRIYGNAYTRWPGDMQAPLGVVIRGGMQFAKAVPVQRAVADVKRRLPRAIVRVIGREVSGAR
jgi:hypothetical protein